MRMPAARSFAASQAIKKLLQLTREVLLQERKPERQLSMSMQRRLFRGQVLAIYHWRLITPEKI